MTKGSLPLNVTIIEHLKLINALYHINKNKTKSTLSSQLVEEKTFDKIPDAF
jgi:hypothetical protein